MGTTKTDPGHNITADDASSQWNRVYNVWDGLSPSQRLLVEMYIWWEMSKQTAILLLILSAALLAYGASRDPLATVAGIVAAIAALLLAIRIRYR
jgi:lipopolysaccharide export LptBFGC system permease protein LptF